VTSPQPFQGLPGVVAAQNQLIDKMLVEGFDFLWLVQADVQVPADAFNNLLSLDVDVAQGVVLRHDDPQALIAGFMDEAAKVWYLPRKAVEGQVLTGWVFAGMSCTLIKKRVLEAGIRFKYQPGVGEDILFMFDVQKAGFVARVHGGVLCGHLPEWPLEPFKPKVLDVGCGHRPQGDVNVDLFLEATAHRAADQRVNDDVALNVRSIPNLVRADALHLPFRDGVFEKSYSWHLIEHVSDAESFIAEMIRVSAGKVEIQCPNGVHPSSYGESKPLHIHRFTPSWFEVNMRKLGLRDISVTFGYSQGEPLEIVAVAEVPKLND
jgi:hypothetical protein